MSCNPSFLFVSGLDLDFSFLFFLSFSYLFLNFFFCLFFAPFFLLLLHSHSFLDAKNVFSFSLSTFGALFESVQSKLAATHREEESKKGNGAMVTLKIFKLNRFSILLLYKVHYTIVHCTIEIFEKTWDRYVFLSHGIVLFLRFFPSFSDVFRRHDLLHSLLHQDYVGLTP